MNRPLRLLLLLACAAGPAFADDAKGEGQVLTPEHWQALARADLDAARKTILEVYPGAIDDQNPAIQRWIVDGHRKAMALVPRVMSYDSMLAVVRHYIGGFADGHLIYSDDSRDPHVQVISTGWVLEWRDGAFRVAGVAPDWPDSLPEVGWRLSDCDGRAPDAILREDQVPYWNHPDGGSDVRTGAYSLGILNLAGLELRECRYVDSAGGERVMSVHYHAQATRDFWPWWSAAIASHSGSRENSYTLEHGVLWIRAGNFSPSPEQMQALDLMLEELGKISGQQAIVFDARGNRGGNSGVGWRIFEAATGGLEYDESGLDALPQTHALWRVSRPALARMEETSALQRKVYGDDSDEARGNAERVKEFREALRDGRDWVRQDSGPLLTRAELARRGAHLKRFDGSVLLLTDKHCVSACLDFADLIQVVPGSVHVGQTTGADAVYIDGGAHVGLPSGNKLVLPLKVWRNRLRGNNEHYVPDVAIDLDALDEATIKQRTLGAIPRASR